MHLVPLTDEQNIALVNNPERIAAEKELHRIVNLIQSSLKFDGSAEYYLKILPPRLKQLEAAYETLIQVEAAVTAKILDLT